jgi:hypothetical protein
MDRCALFAVYVALGGAILAAQRGNQDDYNHIPHPPYPPSPLDASMNWADRHAPPKGPVARIVFKNFIVGAGMQRPQLLEEVVQEFDELAQEISELGTGYSSLDGSAPVPGYQSKIAMAYQGGHMISRDTMTSYNRQPFTPETSDRWEYDSSGQLIDFQQRHGNEVDLHYSNFKYDAAGRLIGFENHGGGGRWWGRLEHRYSEDGRSIKTLLYFGARTEADSSQTLTLDEKGQIVELETALWDYQTKRLKRTAHETFRYDERGRCVEQDTDQSVYNPVTGYVPPKPGKVIVTYDDLNRTQEVSPVEGEQHLAFKIRLNEKGEVASFGANLSPLGEFLTVEPECKYDAYGNWTECKEFLVEKGARKWSHWYTRTITYR